MYICGYRVSDMVHGPLVFYLIFKTFYYYLGFFLGPPRSYCDTIKIWKKNYTLIYYEKNLWYYGIKSYGTMK